MNRLKIGDKVRITVKGYYKEGTIVAWRNDYHCWQVCMTSRFCRGELLWFTDSMLELR